MKFRIILFFLFAFFANYLIADLDRNYVYQGKQIYENQLPTRFNRYEYRTDAVCKNCFEGTYGWFDVSSKRDILGLIPDFVSEGNKKNCIACGSPSFYSGYILFFYRKEYPFLSRQVDFIKKYPEMTDFWPEVSLRASEVKDKVISLFYDLFEKTTLDDLARYSKFRNQFILETPYLKKIDKEIYIKSIVANCFLFSDYYQVLEDLRIFSKKKMFGSEVSIIENIDIVLEELNQLYRPWYDEIESKSQIPEIAQEILFLDYLFGVWNEEEINSRAYFEDEELLDQPRWFNALFCLVKGQAYNEALQFETAIQQFSKAIEYNPDMVDAYIERAIAYFELGQFDPAIEDYKKTTFLRFNSDTFPKNNTLSFELDVNAWKWTDQGGYYVGTINHTLLAAEFIDGLIEGINCSCIEFVPNSLRTLTGLSNGLWAFSCSPDKVSKHFLDSLYNLVEYIYSESNQEILKQIIPELRELIEEWDLLTNEEISNKMGFIIGKYGFDIFAPGACLKGIKRYQHLKQTNALLTLNQCAYNPKKIVIFEEVAKRQTQRKTLFENGKIKIHWGRQNKHISGTNNYDTTLNRSVLEHHDPTLLLKNYGGTGIPKRGVPGQAGYKEVVDFNEHIGIWKSEDGFSQISTTRGIIHYSKDGAHIVPAKPK